MGKYNELTQARVLELFDYDPATGIVTNKLPRKKVVVGSEAGWLQKDRHGKLRRYIGADYGRYIATHIIWLMVYGKLPDVLIDHADGDTLNNRLENLREATYTQNNTNKCVRSDNSSGTTGVGFRKDKNKWRARIHINGKERLIGYFDSKDDAVKAVIEAQNKHYGEFVRT